MRTIAGEPSVGWTRARAPRATASSPAPPPISSTRAPRGNALASARRTAGRCAATLRHAPKRVEARRDRVERLIAGLNAAASGTLLLDLGEAAGCADAPRPLRRGRRAGLVGAVEHLVVQGVAGLR